MGSPVTVPRRFEDVGVRARALHETGNWIMLTDCPNAFNTVNRTAVLAKVATYEPALAPFVFQVLRRETH